ncbi:MAG: RluA family pseudouridine synthase [Bacteroidota bacterium]
MVKNNFGQAHSLFYFYFSDMFTGFTFDILFEDEQLIVINKPVGILVHRTKISEDQQFVLQLLRNQIRQRVYPIHRLDRGTSGVLLFGKTKVMASQLNEQFREQQVRKSYLAIVRGFVETEGTIDYALQSKSHQPRQEAITRYQSIAQTTFAAAISRYPSSRYSLVYIHPQTGRQHQIRKHFAHLRHPVIGDKRYGDCKHNKYFREVLDIPRMLLHAHQLHFTHPLSRAPLLLSAPLDAAFQQTIQRLQFSIHSDFEDQLS